MKLEIKTSTICRVYKFDCDIASGSCVIVGVGGNLAVTVICEL